MKQNKYFCYSRFLAHVTENPEKERNKTVEETNDGTELFHKKRGEEVRNAMVMSVCFHKEKDELFRRKFDIFKFHIAELHLGAAGSVHFELNEELSSRSPGGRSGEFDLRCCPRCVYKIHCRS